MGEALKNAFDLLNLNRMQSGIDTYGQGRCPFYLEPSVIIVITDGGRYSFKNGVHQEIIMNQYTGMKLTKEPFRWDQRLFSLVLRMAGNKIDERVEGMIDCQINFTFISVVIDFEILFVFFFHIAQGKYHMMIPQLNECVK